MGRRYREQQRRKRIKATQKWINKQKRKRGEKPANFVIIEGLKNKDPWWKLLLTNNDDQVTRVAHDDKLFRRAVVIFLVNTVGTLLMCAATAYYSWDAKTSGRPTTYWLMIIGVIFFLFITNIIYVNTLFSFNEDDQC